MKYLARGFCVCKIPQYPNRQIRIPAMDTSISSVAALALSRLLESGSTSGKSVVTDGVMEVVLVFRPVAAGDLKLTKSHSKVLSVLESEPKSAKQIARESGYSPGSLTAVRQCLCDLVRAGRVSHTPDGYTLPKV